MDPAHSGKAVGMAPDGSEPAMAGRRLTLARVDAATVEATRMFLERVETTHVLVAALLYGSRARGDHRPDSDADLAVILSGRCGDRSAVGRAFSGIAFDVLMETGIRIHALPLWEPELAWPASFSNPALIAIIQREGVQL